MKETKKRTADMAVGMGLVLGAGIGSAMGVVIGGGPGIALGAALGAGLGVVVGAVWQAVGGPADPRQSDRSEG